MLEKENFARHLTNKEKKTRREAVNYEMLFKTAHSYTVNLINHSKDSPKEVSTALWQLFQTMTKLHRIEKSRPVSVAIGQNFQLLPATDYEKLFKAVPIIIRKLMDSYNKRDFPEVGYALDTLLDSILKLHHKETHKDSSPARQTDADRITPDRTDCQLLLGL